MEEVAKIQIDPRYFREIVKTKFSRPIWWIWAREVYQNSVDAGATKVDIRVSDGIIECEDNGCGMEDLGVFLGLGAKTKEDGDIGAFGTAKEIILFAWAKWEVHSLGNYLSSEMLDKEPIRQVERRIGTLVRAWGDDIKEQDAREYLETCNSVPVYLNGERIGGWRKGRLKQETDWAEVYVNKGKTALGETIAVRVKGVTMFTERIYGLQAQVTVELLGGSYDMLTENRLALRGDYWWELHRLKKDFQANPTAATRIQKEDVIEFYSGEGRVLVEASKAEEYVQEEGVKPAWSNAPTEYELNPLKSKVRIEVLAQVEEGALPPGFDLVGAIADDLNERMSKGTIALPMGRAGQEPSEEFLAALSGAVGQSPSARAALAIALGGDLDESWDGFCAAGLGILAEYERVLRGRLAARPEVKKWRREQFRQEFYRKDFVVKRIGGRECTLKLHQAKYGRILAGWEVVLTKAYEVAGITGSFVVGFITGDGSVRAEVSSWGDLQFFLINPRMIKVSEPLSVIVARLRDLACHEVAHLYYGDHNESWAGQEARLQNETAALVPGLRKLLKGLDSWSYSKGGR